MSLSDRDGRRVVGGIGQAAHHVPLIAYVYLAIIVLTWAGNWPLMKLALAHAPFYQDDSARYSPYSPVWRVAALGNLARDRRKQKQAKDWNRTEEPKRHSSS